MPPRQRQFGRCGSLGLWRPFWIWWHLHFREYPIADLRPWTAATIIRDKVLEMVRVKLAVSPIQYRWKMHFLILWVRPSVVILLQFSSSNRLCDCGGWQTEDRGGFRLFYPVKKRRTQYALNRHHPPTLFRFVRTGPCHRIDGSGGMLADGR